MAQFTFVWDNTDANASSNNTNQTAYYRRKSVGGTWLSDGFTPTNPLAKTATTVQSKVLAPNIIYEFKVDCGCTQNGPSSNDNGVIEQIGFAEILPDIVNTSSTSAIGIDVTGIDIQRAQFTLRKTSDNSIVTQVLVDRVGNMISALGDHLTGGTNYYWQIVLFSTVNGIQVHSALATYINNVFGPYAITTSAIVHNYAWVKNTYSCQKEGSFGILKTISGIADPGAIWFDSVTGKVFVADLDAPGGNVYWFDPATATTAADMIYSNKIVDANMYCAYVDGPKRKIYFAGKNSGGLKVYNIDTDTVTTVACGTDGTAFNRLALLVTSDKIYIKHVIDQVIYIIDRNTLTLLSSVAYSSIPSNTALLGGTTLTAVGSEIWVVAGSGSSLSNISRYSNDFTTYIGAIALPSCAMWDFARYWQVPFFDEVDNKFYVMDIGSSTRFVVDCGTNAVVNTQTCGNRQGKTNVNGSWTKHPITGDLYFSQQLVNSSSDNAPIKRTYLEDKTTHNYLDVYEGVYYTGLMPWDGTNKVMGVNLGIESWFSPNTGYNTDGSIIFFDSSIGTDNTGVEIVNTLKQIDLANGSLPTGLTKNNISTDPDYIAPSSNPTDCPISYSIDCPVNKSTTFSSGVLVWEFAIENSVKINPAIAKIQVFAFNTNTSATEGVPQEFAAPFGNKYYTGSFTSLGGLNYGIKIKYLNSSNIEIQNC